MKFYMTPGSCSIGIHILLEELDLVFEAHVIDLLAGDHRKPAYLAINPRGSVPTLVRNDGVALTDFASIAIWLATEHPKRDLLPAASAERARVIEVMNFATGYIHGEGFTRVFVSGTHADSAAERAVAEREGRAIVERGFARLAPMLTSAGFVVDRFSIADAALFYVEFWADRIGMRLPERCQIHYLRMLERRAVRQVLAEEGYASTLRKYPAPHLL
ncbi:glutathione S-transferase family protein [Sorangium sp. So ce1024]|uniref:glutathione S-transferase family protein n=1 Tax=unclassified Sorangium TaxID=2621164 RepID=UPI003F0C9847